MLNYFRKEIWQVKIETLSKWKALRIRFLRVVLLTISGFTKSQIQQGASGLTYYSLLAIVPVIALLIGIARGFLFEQRLETWLLQHFSEQEEIIQRIFKFANTSLQQAKGGVIAGVGIALFLWAAIKILLSVEFVMNQIWEVKKTRSIARRFTDYFALILLAPIIIFLASGLSGYISATISAVAQRTEVLKHLASVLLPILNTIPFFLTCLLLTYLYIFMPNTRVRFVPALIAGVSTGILYQFVQWIYLYFQIGVAKYNAIYGTFAALPLFLIWLHLSWMIVLMGAKISFAIQNADAYEFIYENTQLSFRFRSICSLRISHFIIKKFINEESPPTRLELSNFLSIPLVLTDNLVDQLVNSEVLIEVIREKDQETALIPAKRVDKLTIKSVLDMINLKGEEIPLPSSDELNLILKSLEKFSLAIEKSDGNLLLKDI